MILCIVLIGVMMFTLPNTYWFLIPAAILLLLVLFSELQGEDLYNAKERKKELKTQSEYYFEYVNNIVNVLEYNGLYSKEQLESLKEECKERLEKHENSYNSIGDKTYNMLIGVPLGALISSMIYKNSDAILNSIVGIIIFGIVVILFVRMCKKISFYTDGYFKDKYLMYALCELDYYIDNTTNKDVITKG